MSEILSEISGQVWGTPMLIFLSLANMILLFNSKLIPIKGFFHSIKLVMGKVEHDAHEEGQLSHFQALCNALAATIGLGNISGVAVAIYQGGPGAIFWMWVAGFLGMNTKFFECTLAVMYRGKDYQNEVQGGPMYYIEKGLGQKFKFLGVLFATFGVVGTLALFQINQLSSFIRYNYSVSNWISGLVFALITGYILFGGLKRIASLTTKVVPFMGLGYVLLCLTIIILNIENLPLVIKSIFYEAFTGKSLLGGVLGISIKEIMQIGIKRAAFSNEAGVGTAPMAHGNAKTNEPVSEGYVAMLGPFFDTVIVCSMTAFVILLGKESGTSIDLNGINLTTQAFVKFLGEFGRHSLGLMIFLFSFSTMVGMANYNKKCWDYLFKGKWGLGEKSFILFYCITILVGSFVKITTVVDIIDICYGLMAVPNIFAVVVLAKKVKISLKDYNQKHKV